MRRRGRSAGAEKPRRHLRIELVTVSAASAAGDREPRAVGIALPDLTRICGRERVAASSRGKQRLADRVGKEIVERQIELSGYAETGSGAAAGRHQGLDRKLPA